jgi:transposase
MRRPIFVRELLPVEEQALRDGLHSTDAFTMRRCQILLASARGKRVAEIAQNVSCDEDTVLNAIHAFHEKGLEALSRGSSRPHTIETAFDAQGSERLREILHQSPRGFGKPSSLWTLDLVAEVSFEQGLTSRQVSGEAVRLTLKRLGIRWKRAKRWISSPDPEYTRKKELGTDC